MNEQKQLGRFVEGRYPNLSTYEISEIFETYSILTEPGKKQHEYGDGEKYTGVEAHVLNYIDDYPGCTVTEIARRWHKTQSSVSQIVRKLKKRELIYSVENADNATIQNMYLTESGKRAVHYHKKFDIYVWNKVIEYLLESYTQEELNTAFHIVADLNKYTSGSQFSMQEIMERMRREEAEEKEKRLDNG